MLDVEKQAIKITCKPELEPQLSAATVVHFTVANILHHTEFPLAEFPELVELAVIGTGLGMLRNNIEFVKQSPVFWDSTHWRAYPRPFLDSKALAYANAMAAWLRSESAPAWLPRIAKELQKPMQKSLKYLHKTGDSFLQSNCDHPVLNQPQSDWFETARNQGVSSQVVAVRHFEPNEHLASDQEELLLEKLRSANRFVALHAVFAVDRLQLGSDAIQSELAILSESPDEELSAKSMITLARTGPLQEVPYEQAMKMVGSRTKHVNFAGMVGLLSRDALEPSATKIVDRAFLQALQTCDYEFVAMFAAAYNKWLPNPKEYLEQLLSGDQPEYLEIAIEAIDDAREQLMEQV